MMTPTIHLNGTSERELLDGYKHAYRAVHDAIEAVQSAAPNARDYYPQGPDAIRVATQEHRARLTKLEEIKREIEEIAIKIQDR